MNVLGVLVIFVTAYDRTVGLNDSEKCRGVWLIFDFCSGLERISRTRATYLGRAFSCSISSHTLKHFYSILEIKGGLHTHQLSLIVN